MAEIKIYNSFSSQARKSAWMMFHEKQPTIQVTSWKVWYVHSKLYDLPKQPTHLKCVNSIFSCLMQRKKGAFFGQAEIKIYSSFSSQGRKSAWMMFHDKQPTIPITSRKVWYVHSKLYDIPKQSTLPFPDLLYNF